MHVLHGPIRQSNIEETAVLPQLKQVGCISKTHIRMHNRGLTLTDSPLALTPTGISAATLPLHILPKILVPLAQFLQDDNLRRLLPGTRTHLVTFL